MARSLPWAAIIVAIGVPSSVLGQPRNDYRSFYDGAFSSPAVNVPFSSREIGIGGPARLCIKWCESDMNPCDPPVYKQADGRCSYDR